MGTAGYTTRIDDQLRGHSLYVSYDDGKSFEVLPMPENVIISDSKMNGLVASRYAFDGEYLYVTMNSTGRWNYIVPLGYFCDTGDVISGTVLRYFFENGRIAGFEDITPEGEHWLNYGLGEAGQVYVSRDGGRTYHEKETALPDVDFGWIDCANQTEIRGVSGVSGVFHMALGEHGLWKLTYHRNSDRIATVRISQQGDSCLWVGIGLGRPGGDFLKEEKMLYLCGKIQREYGFYCTLESQMEYTRLNTAQQMFGEIFSIDGDKRKFGRFFLATGSRGVLYGDEL